MKTMANLPATFEEFIQNMEPTTKHDSPNFPNKIYEFAKELHALVECQCGNPMVNVELFVQNVEDHYHIKDNEGRIEEIFLNSDVETAVGKICSLCDHKLRD